MRTRWWSFSAWQGGRRSEAVQRVEGGSGKNGDVSSRVWTKKREKKGSRGTGRGVAMAFGKKGGTRVCGLPKKKGKGAGGDPQIVRGENRNLTNCMGWDFEGLVWFFDSETRGCCGKFVKCRLKGRLRDNATERTWRKTRIECLTDLHVRVCCREAGAMVRPFGGKRRGRGISFQGLVEGAGERHSRVGRNTSM